MQGMCFVFRVVLFGDGRNVYGLFIRHIVNLVLYLPLKKRI